MPGHNNIFILNDKIKMNKYTNNWKYANCNK